MLVLSRKLNEAVIVGNGLLKIVVVDIRGDKVRLGFEAPEDLSIHRWEVQDKIDRAKLSEPSTNIEVQQATPAS